MKLPLALCLLLLMILQLCHLPPPLPPPVGNSSCLFTWYQFLYASCCIYYCTFQGTALGDWKGFLCFFLMYHLCEEYYDLLQYGTIQPNCVSWVPRLTLLDSWPNWTYKHALRMELICIWWGEKAMAPHSRTLAWKIPWTEEPGRLQSMGSLRVGHDWASSLSLFTFMHWRRKWQPTPVFLPGESQGRGNLMGCRLWGSTESDTTEVT